MSEFCCDGAEKMIAQQKVHASNPLERLYLEDKRRLRVVGNISGWGIGADSTNGQQGTAEDTQCNSVANTTEPRQDAGSVGRKDGRLLVQCERTTNCRQVIKTWTRIRPGSITPKNKLASWYFIGNHAKRLPQSAFSSGPLPPTPRECLGELFQPQWHKPASVGSNFLARR